MESSHENMPTAVLLAGLWLDRSAWRPVVPLLREAGLDPVAVALPGQDDDADATLQQQLDAVLQVLDRASGPVLLVGHSAACTLAWLAADRRPERVAAVALVGGAPQGEGELYAPYFEPVDARVAFPGWEAFAGPDSDDLDPRQRQALSDLMRPVPAGVTHTPVHYTDPRRKQLPVSLVCPEYSVADARQWVEGGDVPELADAPRLSYVDLDSGHWPMTSAPQALAEVLVRIARDAAVVDAG